MATNTDSFMGDTTQWRSVDSLAQTNLRGRTMVEVDKVLAEAAPGRKRLAPDRL